MSISKPWQITKITSATDPAFPNSPVCGRCKYQGTTHCEGRNCWLLQAFSKLHDIEQYGKSSVPTIAVCTAHIEGCVGYRQGRCYSTASCADRAELMPSELALFLSQEENEKCK